MSSLPIAVQRRPRRTIAAASAILPVLALVFITFASKVADGKTYAMDRALLIWVRLHLGGSPTLRSFMLDLTTLGDTIILSTIVVLVAGYLTSIRRLRTAALLLLQTAIGTSLAAQIKPWIGRVRPEVVTHWDGVASASFPSGHAANSAVVYLSLAALARRAAPNANARVYVLAVAMMLACGVGLSRIYLGVHWPTDVLAGWALGSGWVILCVTIARSIDVTRQICDR